MNILRIEVCERVYRVNRNYHGTLDRVDHAERPISGTLH